MDLSPELMLALLAHLPEGVLLLDVSQDEPQVLYAHGTGQTQSLDAVLGPVPLTELMGWTPQGPELAGFLLQLESGEPVLIELPRTEGKSTLQLMPMPRAAGSARVYIGLERTQAAGTERLALAGVPVILREDRLTGLAHRDWFWELYRRDFSVATREHRALSVFVIDIDSLGTYNDTFGRSAGDSLLRQVGRALLSGMRRASDLVARDEAGRYVALAIGQSPDQTRRHAEHLASRVRDLRLHHPRSGIARFVTVSIGVAQWDAVPRESTEISADALYAAALAALADSRRNGRNRATVTVLGEET